MTRPANTDCSLEINTWKRSHGVFFFHTVGLHKRNVCFYLIFTRTAASSLSSAPLEFLLVRFFACALSALCSSRPLTFSFMRFSQWWSDLPAGFTGAAFLANCLYQNARSCQLEAFFSLAIPSFCSVSSFSALSGLVCVAGSNLYVWVCVCHVRSPNGLCNACSGGLCNSTLTLFPIRSHDVAAAITNTMSHFQMIK